MPGRERISGMIDFLNMREALFHTSQRQYRKQYSLSKPCRLSSYIADESMQLQQHVLVRLVSDHHLVRSGCSQPNPWNGEIICFLLASPQLLEKFHPVIRCTWKFDDDDNHDDGTWMRMNAHVWALARVSILRLSSERMQSWSGGGPVWTLCTRYPATFSSYVCCIQYVPPYNGILRTHLLVACLPLFYHKKMLLPNLTTLRNPQSKTGSRM